MEYYQPWPLSAPPQSASADPHSAPDDWPPADHPIHPPLPAPVAAPVANPAPSHLSYHPAIDLPDHIPYSDMTAPPSAAPAPNQGLYPNWPGYDFYFSPLPAYPLSTYSSLNGATGSPALPPPQPESSLSTTQSGPSTDHIFNGNGNSLYQYQHGPMARPQPPQPAFIDPSMLHTTNISPLSPIQSTSQALLPASATPTSARPKPDLASVFKPLLTPTQLASSSAVGIIVRLLEAYNFAEIAAPIRSELFSKLSLQADDQFFKGWIENESAMEITRSWLKQGAADADDGPWKASVNPILSAIGRMRFTIDSLKQAKLGKIILKLTKDSNSATRDLSLALEKKWRDLLVSSDPPTSASRRDETEDAKMKKRKLPEASTSRQAPAKRPALAAAPVKVPVKKEPKVVVTSVKESKPDSSFFSKPKAKLPSFKKSQPTSQAGGVAGPSQPATKAQENVSQPSSFDPFQDVLRSMKRTSSPKTEVKPSVAQPRAAETPPLPATGGKKKRVSFAPDGQLEQIKIIERAIYDDDPAEMGQGMQSLRDLDRGEGAALHGLSNIEDLLDWLDPSPVQYDLPIERGSSSTEKSLQEEREQSSLAAVYISLPQIPESPTEPQAAMDEDTSPIKPMRLGEELQTIANYGGAGANIADLLGQMAGSIGQEIVLPGEQLPNHLQQQHASAQVDGRNFLSFLSNEQVNQLLQQLNGTANQQGNGHQLPEPTWNQQLTAVQNVEGDGAGYLRKQGEGDGGWPDRGRGRGRGRGFGRGRGKRRTCAFFAEGRCRYGDQCDYAHDGA